MLSLGLQQVAIQELEVGIVKNYPASTKTKASLCQSYVTFEAVNTR